MIKVSLSLICFVLAVSVAAATSVRYDPRDVAALKGQISKLRSEILEEKKRDESLLQERNDAAQYAVKEETVSLAAYKTAQNATIVVRKEHERVHASYNTAKLEYATNRLVRDKETKTINSVFDEIDNLVKIGKGVIGDMGQGNKLLQLGLNNMLQLEKLKKMTASSATDNLVQIHAGQRSLNAELHKLFSSASASRAHPKTDEMKKALNVLLAKLKDEEVLDSRRVKVQGTAANAQSTKLAEATAAVETRRELKTQSIAARLAADAALAEQTKAVNDANLVRDKELDKLKQFEEELDNLVAVRSGTSETELVQAHINRSVITRMLESLGSMKKAVQFEESTQLRVKSVREKAAAALRSKAMSAQTDYRAQLAESKELLTKHNLIKGEMESAEGQLAAERATALQESNMIKQLRVTIKQFSESSVTALGNCPEHHGLVCSGQGTCHTSNFTCKCGFGRTGKACQFCSFGFKMVNSICLKDSVAEGMKSISDVQLAVKEDSDSSLVLLQLQTGVSTGRAYAEMSSIEQLLTGLERKLKDSEKQLVEARDRQVMRYRDAKAKYQASMALLKSNHQLYLQQYNEYKKSEKLMRLIRAMYDYERPLRVKELASIDKMVGLVNQLAGIVPAPAAPAVPTQVLSAQ